ncbi:hypothetical protein Cob_v002862 [Colletotrichum orbiculare MAFF 240422]|uniref:Uncharacterized protein n=1 Tax=Colletotrichum orbiculare (strain 104-T / ATCC 96160 / CBS 514.97 / LARS 414 / MAFF 240422) TaxID=1213857 RepID=A0A484G0P6_COLOR|nr:hypothetical protein Cob_v002862 [Colletotrichum orbiculare MAFF 240422]
MVRLIQILEPEWLRTSVTRHWTMLIRRPSEERPAEACDHDVQFRRAVYQFALRDCSNAVQRLRLGDRQGHIS